MIYKKSSGAASPSSTQVTLKFIDGNGPNGVAARAGAQNVKAILEKNNYNVSMTIQAFSLDNSTGQLNNGLYTDYDLIPIEAQIPAAYRPVVSTKFICFDINDGSNKYQCEVMISSDGYVEIVPLNPSTGAYALFAGGPVHSNAYSISLNWMTGPAFV